MKAAYILYWTYPFYNLFYYTFFPWNPVSVASNLRIFFFFATQFGHNFLRENFFIDSGRSFFSLAIFTRNKRDRRVLLAVGTVVTLFISVSTHTRSQSRDPGP